MLLLALGVTFFFEVAAEPGDLQRSTGTVLAGLTLILALYRAEVAPRWLRVAAAIIVASVATKGSTVRQRHHHGPWRGDVRGGHARRGRHED